MAVSRITTATVQAVSNQVLTIAGALDTEGSARPAWLRSVTYKGRKFTSTSAVEQSAAAYLKFFNNALSSDVNADHLTGMVALIKVDTLAVAGQLDGKVTFAGGGIPCALGLQMCIDTTPQGSTGAATSVLPEEILVEWDDYGSATN